MSLVFGLGVQHHVHRYHVGFLEERLLRYAAHADCGSALIGEVRAPRDDVHAECETVFRNEGAETPETEHAQRLAHQRLSHHRLLPGARTHRFLGLRHALEQRQYQRPCDFGRRSGAGRNSRRKHERDLAALQGFGVYAGVAPTGAHHQLQIRQLVDDLRRKARALAHCDDHVVRLQPLDDLVLRWDVVSE